LETRLQENSNKPQMDNIISDVPDCKKNCMGKGHGEGMGWRSALQPQLPLSSPHLAPLHARQRTSLTVGGPRLRTPRTASAGKNRGVHTHGKHVARFPPLVSKTTRQEASVDDLDQSPCDLSRPPLNRRDKERSCFFVCPCVMDGCVALRTVCLFPMHRASC